MSRLGGILVSRPVVTVGAALVLGALALLATSPSPAQAPRGMVQSLRREAGARFPDVRSYSIVRWGSQNFALTATRQRETCATWELIDGRWSFIFSYAPGGAGSERRINALYAQHQFSTSMRRRLEADLRRFP